MTSFFERSRFALRLLARHKRFSALAMISLAMAIALNTTMYSVLDTMISPKLLIPDHEQLFGVPFYGDYYRVVPQREKDEMLESAVSFAAGITGAQGSWDDRLVEGGGIVHETSVVTVRPNYFQVLGVRASAGRLITPADVGVPARPVVVSERLWNTLFPDKDEFEPSTIVVGGEPRTVVGTLSNQSDFPGRSTGVWQLPLPAALSTIPLSIVRLKPGSNVGQLASVLETIAGRINDRARNWSGGYRIDALTKRPFRVNRFHWALVGSVFAVLLIACANLANLQLARGVSRSRELATRTAVGASRGDIIRQLVMESAWLAFGGLVLGAFLTAWGMKLVDANVPPALFEYVTHTQVSWRVVLFAVTATLFCLMLVGLAPALKLSRVDINEVLKSGAGTGKSRSTRRQYGFLVAVEVGLALSVLCSASLIARAAYSVLSFDGGFAGAGMVSTRVYVVPSGPTDRRSRQDWTAHLISQALQTPGVTTAAVVRGESPKTHAISIDDPGGAPKNVWAPMWGYSIVTPDYLRTMGMKIIRGRDFTPSEFAEPLVIVDRSTAAFLWPGVDPIGKLIKMDSGYARKPWLKVIGVADNTVRWFNPNEYERTRAVRPHLGRVFVLQSNDTTRILPPEKRNRYSANFELVVRGTGDPRKIPTELRRTLGDLGPGNFVSFPLTWEQQTGMARLRAKHSFMATLFTLFGVMGMALAALGIYAIIAHMVAQRTREFGVRIAVGAGARDIRELVIREGNVLTLLGIVLGLLVTAYSAGFVREFVFSDDDRYDSRVFAVVCLALFGIAWLASYIPARRAMRIDPVEALRND